MALNADEMENCASLDYFDKQLVGRNAFKFELGWAPVSRKQTARCKLSFSAPIEMRKKYADYPVKGITDD